MRSNTPRVPCTTPGTGVTRGVLKGLDFFLLTTAQVTINRQPPTTTNHQPPPTASGDQPPTANRQPLPTTSPQPRTAANHHQPPPTATNCQSPTANRPPATANTWCARGLFWENCVQQHLFFPVKDRPGGDSPEPPHCHYFMPSHVADRVILHCQRYHSIASEATPKVTANKQLTLICHGYILGHTSLVQAPVYVGQEGEIYATGG